VNQVKFLSCAATVSPPSLKLRRDKPDPQVSFKGIESLPSQKQIFCNSSENEEFFMGERGERRQQVHFRNFTIQDSARVFQERQNVIRVIPQVETAKFAPSGTIVKLAKEIKLPTPDILSIEWLQQEVPKERAKPVPPGKTPWYHLPGTGFWVIEQIDQLMRDGEISNVGVDTRFFVDEYMEQMANLRWNLSIGEVAGKKRIICPDYRNRTLESTTSKDERDGVVHETLFGNKEKGIVGIEEQIINASVGTMVIIVSPEGWSGLKDADGKPIRYPESQTYCILKLPGGRLHSYTLRSKANILQNEVFQRSLGLRTPEIKDQKERIKTVFKNVAIITPEVSDQAEQDGRKPIRTFEDVIDLMQDSVGGRAEAYEGKTYDDMRAYIRNPENFTKRHPLTEPLIKRFEDYARWRFAKGGRYDDIVTDLQIALAFNPMQLGKLYREERTVTIVDEENGMRGNSMREALAKERLVRFTQMPGGINYQMELKKLQELPGCAGGGATTSVFSLGGRRNGTTENGLRKGENYSFDHKGDCVNCEKYDWLGPCDICAHCDAEMGGIAAKDLALAA
jgi:hypothetical protein